MRPRAFVLIVLGILVSWVLWPHPGARDGASKDGGSEPLHERVRTRDPELLPRQEYGIAQLGGEILPLPARGYL